MRVLIALSCLMAVASAGYNHGYHVPAIGPHGVPLDEPAVVAAKAHHFQAYAEAASRAGHGHGGYDDGSYHDDGSYQDNGLHAENYAHDGQKWHGPIHIPVIGPHGVPIEEPAVQHARAEHLAAHGHGHAVVPYAGHYGGHYASAVNHGAPHDTPEVAAAKAAHFAAHAQVAGHGHYRKKRGLYGYAGHYAGPQHLPVIGPHGVPLDEPAVAHAKAEHAAAHAKASALAGSGHYAGGYDGAYDGQYDGSNDGAYNGGYSGHYAHEGQKWHGPIHIPVIGPHGVPVDELAVQHARAEHLAAHGGGYGGIHGGYGGHYGVAPVAAYAGHYGYHGPQHIPVIGPHGVPLDEPAVAHAKAEHAAAHAEASARGHGGYHQW